jgi:hypothetical protein
MASSSACLASTLACRLCAMRLLRAGIAMRRAPRQYSGLLFRHHMITNERQYLITQTQAAKFREALAAAPTEGLHPKALKTIRDGARSQLAELEEQLAAYAALRGGANGSGGEADSAL